MPWGWSKRGPAEPVHGGNRGTPEEAKVAHAWPAYEAAFLRDRLEFGGGKYGDGADREVAQHVYYDKVSEDYKAEADENLRREFNDWLQGMHRVNRVETLYPKSTDPGGLGGVPKRRAVYRDNGEVPGEEMMADWNPTYWGRKQLTHLPGVREYLREGLLAQDEAEKQMNLLAEHGPQNLEQAWMYFKHWVKGRPVSLQNPLYIDPKHSNQMPNNTRPEQIGRRSDFRHQPPGDDGPGDDDGSTGDAPDTPLSSGGTELRETPTPEQMGHSFALNLINNAITNATGGFDESRRNLDPELQNARSPEDVASMVEEGGQLMQADKPSSSAAIVSRTAAFLTSQAGALATSVGRGALSGVAGASSDTLVGIASALRDTAQSSSPGERWSAFQSLLGFWRAPQTPQALAIQDRGDIDQEGYERILAEDPSLANDPQRLALTYVQRELNEGRITQLQAELIRQQDAQVSEGGSTTGLGDMTRAAAGNMNEGINWSLEQEANDALRRANAGNTPSLQQIQSRNRGTEIQEAAARSANEWGWQQMTLVDTSEP